MVLQFKSSPCIILKAVTCICRSHGGLKASEKEGKKMHQVIILVIISQASFLMGVPSLNVIIYRTV